MKESDLYLPLKRFLESQQFEVSLNLDVILQAVARLSLTPKVYIGVPAECGVLNRRRRHTIKLLRMLGLGLIVIQSKRSGSAKVLLDPGDYTPRRSKPRRDRLLGEFTRRVGDPNRGGSETRAGIMTSYRQRALGIARFLQEAGPTKASRVADALQEPKARDFLYRDVYGWFDKASLGVYDLSPRGRREISLWLDMNGEPG